VDGKVPRIGLISDTHGLLRREATAVLQGCDHIIHAGDIGPPEILVELSALAPVSAVRGNNDRAAWARQLPESRLLRFGVVHVYVIHDLAQFERAPQSTVVVSGHSHQPSIRERDGVLYVNPGSAGPRRFKLPIAVGELMIDGSAVSARVIELTAPSRA
jgi:putative phosphoesterase